MNNGNGKWPDAYRSGGPQKSPVKCVKCQNPDKVITTKAMNPRTGEEEWRLTCLGCRVAWPMDQHGGEPDEYM